jgi:hypothetical protein
LVALLLTGLAAAAAAQATATAVHVSVSDAVSGAPVSFARVLLFGPRNANAVAGNDGQVVLEDLPPGDYAVVVDRRGYAVLTRREIVVEAGRTVTLTVKLQKAGLATIGTVAVRSSAGVTLGAISEDGEQAALSDNLLEALRLGSNVSAVATAGSLFASIDGHPPNDTGVAIDGVPIAPPGSPVSLNVLSPSLFSGLSVDRSGGNGSSALLNFRTADPTIAWQSTLQQTLSGRTQASAATLRGSAGYVGLSFSHAVDERFGPLQGLAYQDASGLSYPHTDAVTSTGDAVKVRVPFAGQVFGLAAVRIESENARACDRLSAPLPCGYGPRNSDATTLRTYQLRDTAVIGATALSAVVFSAAQTERYDFANRTVGGVVYPFAATVESPTSGYQWMIDAPAGAKHVLSLSGYAVQGRALSAGAGGPFEVGDRFTYRTLMLSDAAKITRRLRATLTAGTQQNSVTSNPYALSSIVFDPSPADRLTFHYSAGALSSARPTFEGVADPAGLQLDCDRRASFGAGPERGAAKSTTTSTSVSWLRRLRGDDQFLASAHREVVYDGAVTTTISAADVPGLLPPGYAHQLESIFTAVCGTPAPELNKQYLFATATAPVLTYAGASFVGRFSVAPRAFVQPYYTLTSVVERGAAAYLSSPSSIVVPGAQLPNVPLHRGGAIAGVGLAKTAQLLFDANYVGANNAQHLPPYWTLDAAYGLRLRYGTLSVIATNLTNAYPGPFATASHAVALPARSGASIPTLAAPLAPRALLVRYRVALGRPPPAAGAADLGSEPDDGDQPSFELLPFSAPASDPFAVQTTAASCGPERAAIAATALSTVRAYLATSHADGSELSRDGLQMKFRKTSGSYGVLIGGLRKLTSALFACAAIHGGKRSEVAALSLYAPTSAESKRYDLGFSPRIGFYVADVVIASESARITYMSLPERAPENPFALRPPSDCPSEIRSAASALLQKLATAVAARARDATTARTALPWTISRHGVGDTGWLEAALPDPNLVSAVMRCAYVHSGSSAAVGARGYGVPSPGAFGFAPALGLYVTADAAR